MNRALRGVVLGACGLGCPQLLDDRFGAAGTEGGAALGGGGSMSSAAGSGGASGTAGRGGASGVGGTGTDGRGGTGAGGTGSAGGGSGAGGSGGGTAGSVCRFSDFSRPELISGLGRSDALYGPSLSGNGLVLAFSESVADGPEDIYYSERGAPGDTFAAALPATGVNTAAAEGTAFLSNDALTLYFFSDRAGGAGGRDIYRASRSDLLDDFADVSPVQGVNGSSDDHMPWLSPDERTIYFASNRAADEGSSNIWFAGRSGVQDGFELPREVTGVNSEARDISPSLSADQRILVFCSDRDGGPGSDDIWMATRDDPASEFGAPEPASVVNGAGSELNVTLSSDGLEIIFSSNRDGGRKLFRSVRTCL